MDEMIGIFLMVWSIGVLGVTIGFYTIKYDCAERGILLGAKCGEKCFIRFLLYAISAYSYLVGMFKFYPTYLAHSCIPNLTTWIYAGGMPVLFIIAVAFLVLVFTLFFDGILNLLDKLTR